MANLVLESTDATFEAQVLGADQPVLVDFYATWCGPCKRLAPVLDQIADNLTGQVSVVKVDIDQAPEAAAAYGVMSVPTLMLFASGAVSGQVNAAQPAARIERDVTALLG